MIKYLSQYGLLACALSVAAYPALSEEILIGAGSDVGEYTNTIVPAISNALAESSDYSATAVLSAGSQENLDKLQAGELQAALTQLDILALQGPEALKSQLRLIGLIAPEALFCAARKDGKVRSYHNFTDQLGEPLVLSIGPEGSGSARTMEFLRALDPDFAENDVAFIYEADIEAELDRLSADTRDAVCFVMMPNPDNVLIKKSL